MKKLFFVLFVIVVVFLQLYLWFTDDGLFKTFRLKKEIHLQQAKNRNMAKHNDNLVKEINSLKKGGEAIENRARNDLGMVKKGEVFYQVVK